MRLILIGGAQRSGTTLVQTLLSSALGVAVLPEAHILSDILASYKRAKASPHKTQRFYATAEDLHAFFRFIALRHIDDLVDALASQSVLVLKDPNFALVQDEIASILPNATIIICVRDPRDIAASFLRIGYRESKQNLASKYQKRDIAFICRKIMSAYDGLLKSPNRKNLFLARYEEIVSSPKQWLEELALKAGLEVSLDRIENPEWLAAHLRHELAWISELEGQKPSAVHVGAFNQVLRAHELVLVEKDCQHVMSMMGYEPISERNKWSIKRGKDYLERLLAATGIRTAK